MLKRIPPIVSPELLYALAQMGHGDEIVFADAHFPAATCARRLIRADGHDVVPLLTAVLTLFPLDRFTPHPAAVMRRVDAPDDDAPIWAEYVRVLQEAEGRSIALERVERFAFYERAKRAFAVVATGDVAMYANLLLAKGHVEP
ncbi:MAG: RbsD/FucU family protein [Planctomycetia bacterium]